MISEKLPSVFASSTRGSSLSSIIMKHTQSAIELKYVVPAWAVGAVLECAREHLDPDPHANPRLGDGYTIHTLYFDTDEFDVYSRQGACRNVKYRIRRYELEPFVYLERKHKPKGHVRKHRTRIPIQETYHLNGVDPDDEWAGSWFRDRLHQRALHPVCQVSYVRTARVGRLEGQPVRFTLDRTIRCTAVSGLRPPEPIDGVEVLPEGQAIVEIKFTESLPGVFERRMNDVGLSPGNMSKYRRGIRALHLAPPRPAIVIEPDGEENGPIETPLLRRTA